MSAISHDATMMQCPNCQTSLLPVSSTPVSGVYSGTCQQCGHGFKFRKTVTPTTQIVFKINGKEYTVGNQYGPSTSLNEYIRDVAGLTGTKVMCREGGCGCCAVVIKKFDPTGKQSAESVNSCLFPLYSCNGLEVTTVEGLGNKSAGYHPIQEKLADMNGSQCGYCSPGMVMTMYGILQRTPKPSKQQIEDNFDGNLCRCTGFRPILDAMKTFSAENNTGDIEDLCPQSGQICTNTCSQACEKQPPVHLSLQDAEWYAPTTVSEVDSLLKQYAGKKIRFVFGHTGVGVYNDGPYDVYINLRGVQSLYSYGVSDIVSFGSNISLNQMIDLLESAAVQPKFQYFTHVANHMKKIANVHVRNAGSWTGNLMLKHQHPDFISDMFTILEAVGARINISDDGKATTYTLTDFLKQDLTGKLVLGLEFYPMTTSDHVRTYKIMPRATNAHAYVNAGFRMTLDSGYIVMQKPSIVFGGINKDFVHASKTEEFLTGKVLTDPQTLQGAFKTLGDEMVPDPNPVLASPAYRKNLACSLLYKYILSVCGDQVDARFKSGGEILTRPLSSGTEVMDTDKTKWPVTEPMPKMSSKQQTAGEAEYVNDMPHMAGEVFGALVVSKQGNCKLGSIDTSAAQSAPGFVKFFSAKDIPGVNNMNSAPMMAEELFASSDIQYAGQPIGMVVADTQTHADYAASLVKVSYTDVKTPILTILQGIQQKSFFPKVFKDVKVGDPDTAISSSSNKISGKISMGGQYPLHMETQTSLAIPHEGGFSVFCTTQDVGASQNALANCLGISANKIDIQVRRLGGGYGGKLTKNRPAACGGAIAAAALNRPVRIMTSFHTNMEMQGGRFPYYAEYEVGTTSDGLLQGVKIKYYNNCGNLPNDQSPAFAFGDNAYYSPCWLFECIPVKTNLPAHTWTRSPGSIPAIFIMETIMEHVAKSLNKDPSAVRQMNLYTKGQTTPISMKLTYCNIRDMYQSLESKVDLVTKTQKVNAFNQANRWTKKGLSVVPLKWLIGYSFVKYKVAVTIYFGDGSVAIAHGGIECGQGVNTKTAQVCASMLGVDLSNVTVKPSDVSINANSGATGGSITSELCCKGVIECCNMLKSRMDPIRAKMDKPTWKELVTKCYNEGVDLQAAYYVCPKDADLVYNSYGVTCSEVTLDVLTGENQVDRVDILMDCGESINPEIDVGQIEGAFVMGLGYWMTEKLKYDPQTGKNLTNGTWEYKPPFVKDIPIDFRVELLKNAPNPVGVLGSKAIGEPPMCMSCSVLFAAKHAVEAARKEIKQDTGYFEMDGPATVDQLQTYCMVDPSQFTLK